MKTITDKALKTLMCKIKENILKTLFLESLVL